MGTNISIYDSPDSVNVNDPEATLTVYEMFIGVGPQGPAGATGPAGAAAVAGPLPSEYVEMTTARTVTSATLIDIPGVTADITLDSTVNIAVFMDCEVSSDGVCDLGLAISINGTDHDVVTTHLNGTSDNGKVTVIHRTATPLAAGTYTVKGRFLRSSGTKTPQVDRADFLVFALQGAKGADSTITIVPTADNDFVIGNSGGTWKKKTLAQAKTALGLATTTSANDFMAGDGAGAWAKKTLAETKTILSITNAPNVATTAAGDLIMGNGAGAWAKKTVAEAQVLLNPYALIGGVLHKQLWITNWRPTVTSGCAASAQIEMGTNKNVYDYVAFDKDTIENAYVNFPMPQDYTGGNLYADVYWFHPTTTTNFSCYWWIRMCSIGDSGSLDIDNGTGGHGIIGVGGTENTLYIDHVVSSFSPTGTVGAGNLLQIKIDRYATSVDDTLAVDAYLLGVMLWYPVR